MKKLMIIAALAAASLAALADRTPAELRDEYAAIKNQELPGEEIEANLKAFKCAITEAEWRGYLDDLVAYGATNAMPDGATMNSKVYAYALRGWFNFLRFLLTEKDLPFDGRALCLEYDERIAALCIKQGAFIVLPKSCQDYMSRAKWRELRPMMYALVEAAIAEGKEFVDTSKLSFAERLKLDAEAAVYARDEYGHKFCSMNEDFPNALCEYLSKAALPVVKRAIRASGKSFVAKEGEANPVEAPLNALTAALNAPRFAGLVEWCDKWCPDASAAAAKLVASLPTEEEIAEMRDGVLYGELDFNGERKAYLRMCLGVEAYNAFVREYNGD